MQVSITTAPHARTMTITVTETDWEKTQQGSFYQGEQAVQQLVTTIGRALVQELLQNKGAIEPTLEEEGQRWYRKEASIGHYHTLYGEVAVERPLYQTSTGGETRCPLEEECQLSFASATPLLAEVLSFKVSAMTPHDVALDLLKQAHGAAGGPARRAKADPMGRAESGAGASRAHDSHGSGWHDRPIVEGAL
jgi:hypothetical protein